MAAQCGLHYVPMGSHEGLGSPGVVKEYDLIGLMCYSNRRSFVFRCADEMLHKVGNVTLAPNGWGEDRHNRLQRSRFMFNVHQDDFPFIEPLRFALAAAYGLPLVTERCLDMHPYMSRWYVDAGLRDMAKVAESAVASYGSDRWYDRGLELRSFMANNMTFGKCLEMHL